MTFVDYLFIFLLTAVLAWVSVEALSIAPDVQQLISSGDSVLQGMRSDLF
jgi:hypothetical protein